MTVTRAGADAAGFLVGLTHASPDQVDPVDARSLLRQLPPFVEGVMVTHLDDPIEIAALATYLGAGTVQLHGEMSHQAVGAVRRRMPLAHLIRVVHVWPGATVDRLIAEISTISKQVDAIILDSRTPQQLGGTGLTHDWTVSSGIVAACPLPVILAGGLTPVNVVDAIKQVHPYAVDVNSGVETATGDKSPDLCRCFVRNARTHQG